MFQIEDINKEIARKHNIDVKLVTEVNLVFWKKVKKAINGHEAKELKLPFLGTFTARFSPVKRQIRSLTKILKARKKDELNPDVTEVYKKVTIGLMESFRKLWRIKNIFSENNVRIKNKKLNKENGK